MPDVDALFLITRCLVEALGANAWEEKKEVVTKEDVMRLWEASPIAHVSKVKTPTMVQISFDDRYLAPSPRHGDDAPLFILLGLNASSLRAGVCLPAKVVSSTTP